MPKKFGPGFKSDKQMIEAALNAFRAFGHTAIPRHTYNIAVREGVSVEGFTIRCQRKVRHGNGKKEQSANGTGAEKLEQPKQNTSVMILASSNASNGCMTDASELESELTSQEHQVAFKLLSENLDQYQKT